MGKLVPVVVHVDPEKENKLTIKPFAAGLATSTTAHPLPEGATGTANATGTNLTGQPDVDAQADADF
jgi:hypothetical protein